MRAKISMALDWARRCFGHDHVADPKVRALRVFEEAAELAQACGVPREKANLCVGVVYDRPIGDWMKEAGGVALTLAVLCGQRGLDYDDLFDAELRRVLNKPIEDFALRNRKKIDLGLTGE